MNLLLKPDEHDADWVRLYDSARYGFRLVLTMHVDDAIELFGDSLVRRARTGEGGEVWVELKAKEAKE